MSLVVLILAFFVCRFVRDSKYGKILIAIRDSEQRIRFTGYSVTYYKLFIFVLAAVLAGIGGFLYVPQTGIVTPGAMDVKASIIFIIMVALGGRGTLVGAIIGAFAYSLLKSSLTSSSIEIGGHLINLADWWLLILGGIFVLSVMFFPTGLVGIFDKVEKRISLNRFLILLIGSAFVNVGLGYVTGSYPGRWWTFFIILILAVGWTVKRNSKLSLQGA